MKMPINTAGINLLQRSRAAYALYNGLWNLIAYYVGSYTPDQTGDICVLVFRVMDAPVLVLRCWNSLEAHQLCWWTAASDIFRQHLSRALCSVCPGDVHAVSSLEIIFLVNGQSAIALEQCARCAVLKVCFSQSHFVQMRTVNSIFFIFIRRKNI